MLIKSLKSPLYINNSNIYLLIADIQAKILINLQLLSYFALVIYPDFKASYTIILFIIRLNLIKKPFSLKLYMFSAIIRYFLIIIAS